MTPDFPGAPGPELAHSHGTAGVPAPLGVGQRCWIQRFEQEQIEATEESRQAVARNPKSPMTESERLGYSNFVIRASLCFLRYLLLKVFFEFEFPRTACESCFSQYHHDCFASEHGSWNRAGRVSSLAAHPRP